MTDDKKGEERKGIKLFEDHERGAAGNAGAFKVSITMMMSRLVTFWGHFFKMWQWRVQGINYHGVVEIFSLCLFWF